MVKLFPIVGALLSIASLILLAIGSSTNKWVILERANNELNPVVVNSKLNAKRSGLGVTSSTSDISYSTSHLGLWIGCHKEHRGAVTCAYVGASCYSNVCWIRRTSLSSTKTCLDSRVHTIPNCTAYQVVRSFVVLGAIVLVFGVAMQIVSLATVNRSLAMLAGLVIFFAGLVVMSAFAIFYSEEVVKGVGDGGRVGYSFKLVASSWPLAMLAGVVSCCAASMGLRHKEVSDYSASNY